MAPVGTTKYSKNLRMRRPAPYVKLDPCERTTIRHRRDILNRVTIRKVLQGAMFSRMLQGVGVFKTVYVPPPRTDGVGCVNNLPSVFMNANDAQNSAATLSSKWPAKPRPVLHPSNLFGKETPLEYNVRREIVKLLHENPNKIDFIYPAVEKRVWAMFKVKISFTQYLNTVKQLDCKLIPGSQVTSIIKKEMFFIPMPVKYHSHDA